MRTRWPSLTEPSLTSQDKMPRDLEIPLCLTCEFRPVDSDTGNGVEGGLNITHRASDMGHAIVIYSQIDPRINLQRGILSGSDSSEAVRMARICTPAAEGLDMGLGDFEKRIREAKRNRSERVCGLNRILFVNKALPEGLLFQVDETARK
ncbi:hypothetical protein BH10PAT3_BH10PAT3_4570 [soil metagenome]